MKIKELCKDDRPREKMLSKGADALSNAELIAILLRTGIGEKNVVDVARDLLRACDGKLSELSVSSVQKMCRMKGVGPSKAVAVSAAFELGRRVAEEACLAEELRIDSPARVCRLMLPYMNGLDHEELWVLFLNRANRLIAREMISSGGQDSTIIDRRMVIRRAIDRKASAIIMVHNHPSGTSYPSREDIRQTREMKTALSSCDIQLIDHVIIAGKGYYSFADEEAIECV